MAIHALPKCALVAALSFGCLLSAIAAHAQESCLHGTCFDDDPEFGAPCCPEEDDDLVCSYGPCPCQPRKTLFQWSYGTSFGGGPPGPDEPLVTDRPDFTEASVPVGRGVVQLEAGYTYTWDDDATGFTRTHSYPEILLRVGVLADWLELRVGWNFLEETTSVGGVRNTQSGSDDLLLGFKIGLTPQEGILPEMALIPQMTVPSGSTAFSANEEVLPGVIWIYAWEINDWLVTAGSSQINRAVDGATNEPFGLFAQSWTIGYGLTDELGAYTEWFVLVPDGADTERTQHFFNGGFTYLINNDLQVDVRAGVGLNEAADDYFLGTGFVRRF